MTMHKNLWLTIILLDILLIVACAKTCSGQTLNATHAYELVFTASGETFIGMKVIQSFKGGSDYAFMAPVLVETGNFMWRAPEWADARTEADRQYALAKFECDTSGVLLAVLVDALFKEHDKK